MTLRISIVALAAMLAVSVLASLSAEPAPMPLAPPILPAGLALR